MELLYKELTGTIVDCAVTVHRFLGPGLLESAYEECLQYELNGCGVMQVCDYPEGLGAVFEIDKEIVAYETEEEAIKKIEYYFK
jgi:hypothetical protein